MSRRQMHAQPRADKWAVAEDISEWMRRVTGDSSLYLAHVSKIYRSDLDALWRAIQASEEWKSDDR